MSIIAAAEACLAASTHAMHECQFDPQKAEQTEYVPGHYYGDIAWMRCPICVAMKGLEVAVAQARQNPVWTVNPDRTISNVEGAVVADVSCGNSDGAECVVAAHNDVVAALEAKHEALLYQYRACHEEKDTLASKVRAWESLDRGE